MITMILDEYESDYNDFSNTNTKLIIKSVRDVVKFITISASRNENFQKVVVRKFEHELQLHGDGILWWRC